MKMQIRRADERGHFDHGWLNTYHTFSFGDYQDPKFEGFRTLRVINEDRVKAGEGFGTHGHRDMEIISYVLEGAIAHKDSLGTGSVIKPGEIQRMSAGTGIRHSEFNHSKDSPVHFLQIWIVPEKNGIAPGYEQKTLPDLNGQLRLIASRDGREGSITVHQDVNVYGAVLEAGQTVEDKLPASRHAWLQVARGVCVVNGEVLSAGDGAAMSGGGPLELKAPVGGARAEVLLFDLA